MADLFEALAAANRARGRRRRGRGRRAPDAPLKLAIVGRPNAGKSTLINRMLGEERLITGPEAGITRDSIASTGNGRAAPVRLIDTAGMRKRAKVEDKLEKLSVADARRAIDFAEVVVLLLDATRGLEAQDLRIADAGARGRPRAGHRAQQMGRGRKCLVAVQRRQGGARRRAWPGARRAAADRLGEDRQGHRHHAQGRVRDARGVVEARVGTGELNRWFEARDRGQSAARARGQADQAALHHPGEDAAAELRRVRHPRRRAARKLSALSGQRDAARPRLRPVPVRLEFRGRKNPFDRDRR